MKKDYIVELREEEADELMDDHWVGELVRCKNCKHSGIDSTSYPHYWCSALSVYREADWFCSDGERKT